MKLAALIQALDQPRLFGDPNIEVAAVRDNSRAVEPGDLFVAVRGRTVDGHQFVADAASRGAAAVVVEKKLDHAVAQVVVTDSIAALAALAAAICGRPADRLALVGITGTNGKTTTSYLAEAIIRAAGGRPGVLGTVNYRFGDRELPAPYTTPPPLVLHQVLRDMADAGCTHAVMEVTSSALAQRRVAGLRFQVAVFTNLTQDHIGEVHDSMETYQEAKQALFRDHLDPEGVAVVNLDDPLGEAIADLVRQHRPRARLLGVSSGWEPRAEVRAVAAETTLAETRARIATPRGTLALVSSALLGAHNVANLATAVALGEALELGHTSVAEGVGRAVAPGRLERVGNDHQLDIFVDYAHTPDALRNVLAALKPLTRRRLICVFGCGGDRDASKRPLMGAVAAELADLVVVTSDNPRTEDPRSIIGMITAAVPAPYFVDPDRRTAICAAVAEATPGDCVVIAGKGHETYQIVGRDKRPFDDREVAKAAVLARRHLRGEEVVALTRSSFLAGRGEETFSRVVIDGRSAAPGDLYVAIRGERFDGHEFCAQAWEGGARGAIVERMPTSVAPEMTLYQVADTRTALGQLARAHRQWWAAGHGERRLVAVTGSTGKTTTKALIAAALAPSMRAHASAGSHNNETGVPLTLLGLRSYHDAAVVEMGMRGEGQIRALCAIALPDVGVIVNVGSAHLGVVGSLEAIARGKSEIFAALPPTGCAVYPAGDPVVAAAAARAPRRLSFGDEPSAEVRLLSYQPQGPRGSLLQIGWQGQSGSVLLPLLGKHNAMNATSAAAAALALGRPLEEILAGLGAARPEPMRSQIATVAERNVLLDCYNANPASMRAALEMLAEVRGRGEAVAVLGDMLELGDTAADRHREAGRQAAALAIRVVAVGELGRQIVSGAAAAGGEAVWADTPAAATQWLRQNTRPGDWILVKASRAMRLERVVEELQREGG